MIRQKLRHLFILIVFLPTVLKAEGQEGLVIILDGFRFLFVIVVWTILFLIILSISKSLRKKQNGLKQKLIIGIACLFFAIFHFIMIKSDPYPYEGPIDEFIHRDIIRADKIRDSLDIWHGKTDSTIETTIASIDTNKIGVYIWLKGQSVFVRKLTPGLVGQKQNDSLTMSIVRRWKK